MKECQDPFPPLSQSHCQPLLGPPREVGVWPERVKSSSWRLYFSFHSQMLPQSPKREDTRKQVKKKIPFYSYLFTLALNTSSEQPPGPRHSSQSWQGPSHLPSLSLALGLVVGGRVPSLSIPCQLLRARQLIGCPGSRDAGMGPGAGLCCHKQGSAAGLTWFESLCFQPSVRCLQLPQT